MTTVKILIAEDDPISSALLQATLTRWGFEVLAAGDGRQALEAMQLDDAPRLAIVDWMMPVMDGIQLCRKLRDGAKDKPLYIIMLSAKAERVDVITGLESGADAYMTKPFDREEFRARIDVGVRTIGLQQKLADRLTQLQGALSRLQETEAISRSATAARKSAVSGAPGTRWTLFD